MIDYIFQNILFDYSMKKIFLSEMFSFYNNKNRIVQCTVFQKSFFLYVIIPKGRNLNIQECQSAKFLSKLEFVFDCCLNFPEDKRQRTAKRIEKLIKSYLLLVSYTCKISYTGCLLQWQRRAMRKSYLQKFETVGNIRRPKSWELAERNNTTNLHATLNMHVLNRMCYKMFLFHFIISWI